MKDELTARVRYYSRLIKRGIEAERRDYQDFLTSEEYDKHFSWREAFDNLRVSWRLNKKYFKRGLEVMLEDLKELNRLIDENIEKDNINKIKYI